MACREQLGLPSRLHVSKMLHKTFQIGVLFGTFQAFGTKCWQCSGARILPCWTRSVGLIVCPEEFVLFQPFNKSNINRKCQCSGEKIFPLLNMNCQDSWRVARSLCLPSRSTGSLSLPDWRAHRNTSGPQRHSGKVHYEKLGQCSGAWKLSFAEQ